jgi:arylsulfatase
MEVFAGFSENTDYEIGRIVQSIEALGVSENTMVIFIWGDNGASLEGTPTGTFNELVTLNGIPLTAEQQFEAMKAYGGAADWGGPKFYPHYSSAWAWAGNAPFQWGKQVASHLGGTRDPMVIAWPRRIKDKGGIRSQFTHAIDVVPTILEAAGIAAPVEVDGAKQMPMHGVSFAYTFDDAKAPERHTQQYFEMLGNRAMYKDGWWLACRTERLPWSADPAAMAKYAPGVWDPDKDPCELYNLDTDFSQADDVAAANPQKVQELKTLFWADAQTYQVLPLFGGLARLFSPEFLPPQSGVTRFVLRPGTENIAPTVAPAVYNRSFTISADLDVERNTCLLGLCYGADGVIVAEGSYLGGYALYVLGGEPRFTYSFLGLKFDTIVSAEKLPAGKVNLRYEFTADTPGKLATGGTGRLVVNGRRVAEGRIENTVPIAFSAFAGLDIGKDNGAPVVPSWRYAWKKPFAFQGRIEKVEFELGSLRLTAAEWRNLAIAQYLRFTAN